MAVVILFQKRILGLLVIGLFGLLVLAGCKTDTQKTSADSESAKTAPQEEPKAPENKTTESEGEMESTETTINERAVIETEKGRMVIELYPDVAPRTVKNFVDLIRKGFYNNLTFHRVEPNFVIQGGDPNGNGTGGPGYQIPAEFNERKHVRGTVAMARSSDPDSAGSQFYICLAPQPSLDGKYTVFGQVVDGLDVIDRIAVGDVMNRVYLEPKPQ